ncbi:HTH domain-containing protein [Aureibacter tunicatorum]|uniref:DNA-binding transcriptional regulator YafY n=1 Tax=Aureibacter tunicatorum TaxID=866807 RepID=A0AAE3XSR2_9BACT|nr:HTH domain-containing protein [Aureibacter tunicatorum]MDR6242088.1 putative DNA-binding transcriptional regulator YafY [Aureibacter tunicatorum]BDD07559.1 hypothetical protein AUTU_50420 [Aureibacter tunicatorum]
MSVIKYLNRIERIDMLIKMKSTGQPQHLADKVGVSKRMIYEIINDMKDLGAPIKYCNYRKSYMYEREGNFKFSFMPKEMSATDMYHINGGSTLRSFANAGHIFFNFS